MNVYHHPEEKVWGGLREVICWMGLAPKLSLKGHSSWRCWKHVVCGLRWSLKLGDTYEDAFAYWGLFPVGKMLLKSVCTSLWQKWFQSHCCRGSIL